MRDFLAGTRSAPAPEVLHTEEWFDVQIAGTKVAGRIDRMDRTADGSVAIVDYKTGKARSQEDADESLQLSIYAMAAHEKWGYRVGALHFIISKATSLFFLGVRSFNWRRRANEFWTWRAASLLGSLRLTLGRHCNFCAFRGLCPAQEKRVPNLGPNRTQIKAGPKTPHSIDGGIFLDFRAKNLGDAFGVPLFLTSY